MARHGREGTLERYTGAVISVRLSAHDGGTELAFAPQDIRKPRVAE